MTVSRFSPLPLSIQIRDAIYEGIEGGQLSPGEQLQPERAFAEHYGVSLSPVRQAMADLVRSGTIVRIPGRGSFVAHKPRRRNIRMLDSITEELRESGTEFEVVMIEQGLGTASEDVASRLEIEPGDDIVAIERAIVLSDGPLVHMRSHLPAVRFESLADSTIERPTSLYSALRNEFGVKVAEARGEIGTTNCNATIAQHLGHPIGAVALCLEAVMYDAENVPVEHNRSTYASRGVTLSLVQRAGQEDIEHPDGAMIGAAKAPA